MSAKPISGFSALLTRMAADAAHVDTPRTDQVGRDLAVLDRGIDTAAPVFELPTLAAFRGSKMNADRVRLPPPRNAGRHVGRAAARILDADVSAASPAKEALVREARMRHVLRAVAQVVDFVQIEAAQTRRS
ncbi:MAG: hypothetical protein RIT81_41045 [Deltaproteobacteria bacterium]